MHRVRGPIGPCPELYYPLPGAIPNALADALEQSSVGLQVTTCRASPDTSATPRPSPAAATSRTLHPFPPFPNMRWKRVQRVRHAFSCGAQPSLWGWLEAPTVPVLYAAGELDATYSGIARQLAAASSPESRLQVSLLPRAAHAVLLQARPRACARANGMAGRVAGLVVC